MTKDSLSNNVVFDLRSIPWPKNGCGLDRLERHYSSPKITLHLTIMAFFVVSQSVWLAYIDKYTTAFVLLSTLHILVTSIPVSQKNIHINICSILVQFCGRKFFSESTSHFFSEKTGTFQGKPNQEKSFFEKLIDDKLWFANALHCFEHFAPKHVLIIYNATQKCICSHTLICVTLALLYMYCHFLPTVLQSTMNGEFQSVKVFFSYSTSENSNFKPSSSFLLLRMEFSSFWKIGVSILVDS